MAVRDVVSKRLLTGVFRRISFSVEALGLCEPWAVVIPVNQPAEAVETVYVVENTYDSDVVAAVDLDPVGQVLSGQVELVGCDADV